VRKAGATATEKVERHCLSSHWYCKSANCNQVRVRFVLDVSLGTQK
jgi:hypothetical protein